MKKFGLLALLVLAVIGLNYIGQDDEVQNPKKQQSDVQEASYFADNLTREMFDAKGQKIQILNAQKAQHFIRPNILRLSAPVITDLSADEPWQIHADKGTLNTPQSQVEMQHNVVIHNPQADRANYTKLSTDYLLYHTTQKVAETDAPVSVTQANATTHATGIRIELATKMLYFKQGVISRYAPNP